MSEEKTVCIVGVAGFIGSHLLEKIIRERTWNVLGCDMVGYEDSDLRIPSMRLIEQQLGWTPPTSLKSAMEATMKVFIEKYADKVQALKRTSDEAEPAAKKAKA